MASENVVLNLNDSPLWAPYKGLFNIVNNAIVRKNIDAVPDLEAALKIHKPNFINLLKNPVRSKVHRDVVKKSSTSGIAIIGQTGLQVLPQTLIEETLIISDMFDLNELTALELLIAGQQQQPHFPGLTRGLVAMLLYYDGRRSLVNALHLLVQAREGRTWTLGLNSELSLLVMTFTDQLQAEGLIMKVIDLIENMNISEELELLHKNRALGGPRYRKQVTELITEIKQSLAEVIFCWSCQSYLTQEEVQRLLNYLSKQTSTCRDGSMNECTLTIMVALLYVIDVRILQISEGDASIPRLNLMCQSNLATAIHKQLMGSQEKWRMPGLKAILQFCWGISLRTISQFLVASLISQFSECIEDDEKTIDRAIEDGAFQAIRNLVIRSSIFHHEEFFLKCIHNIITDFIMLMPIKIKEIRNRGDETARMIATYAQEGLEPPANLPLHFEQLMNLVSDLYAQDPLKLELASEYWCPIDNSFEQTISQRPSQKQIALYKFIRLAADLLPPVLFVPYHNMLSSLSNSPICAHNCFTLLKINGKNGNQSSLVSWDHFFSTLHRYYGSLHEEVPQTLDQGAYPQRMHSKGITPQEVHGLISVLQLITQVVKLDEIARITLAENPQYVPTVVLLGLITCSIPATLKASLIYCLSAFASSPEIALNIWQGLEISQIIPTVKTISVHHPSGILMELEEVETRMEEYPVTQAMLALLGSLLDHPYPSGLGGGVRLPGIEPYLHFARDSVLLRCNSRAYKFPEEKWKIMTLCLKILEKIILNYRIKDEQTTENLNSTSSLGISVLSKMLQDSGLLRVILYILDEGVQILDQYTSLSGQCHLEECTLLALKLIHETILRQEAFLQQVRDSGCDLIVTSLDNLLLSINPRSGQADHLFVIAKYVTYNTFMPEHSFYSICILYSLCSYGHIAQHLVGVFNSDPKEGEILLNGFVEALEVDVTGEQSDDNKANQDRNKTRQHLLLLLLKCLHLPGPNVSHFLLGFQLRKPIAQTEIQEPGVLSSNRTCLHAVLSFLDSGTPSNPCLVNIYASPYAAELSYQLIYALCTNKETSGPTLRYLRSTHDFLFRHLHYLPLKTNKNSEVKLLMQQSWLLKILAVELRVTSAHHQRSHVQRLLNILLDDSISLENGLLENFEPSFAMSASTNYSFMKPGTGIIRRKLMRFLDSIDFQQPLPISPHWDYFENDEVERVLKACEMQEVNGFRLINIEELHSKLSEETFGLQNPSMLGQRPIVIQEISKVLEYAVHCNESREIVFSKKQMFDAWRQVTEVLLIACPLEILGNDRKNQMILEISQELLRKIMSENILPELMPPTSGIILTLMAALHNSMISSEPDQSSQVSLLHNAGYNNTTKKSVIPLTHHSSILVVLRSVIECLLKTGSGSQRVRANFYSAFLNLLGIVQTPICIYNNNASDSETGIDQEAETKKLRVEYMDAILSFGEAIMEMVSRDACSGHDITKMLALSVLDIALSLDCEQQWLAFLVSKGYLRHILVSLSKDDRELQNLFNKDSTSFRIFYVFESKMALLARIACSTAGALALLRNGIVHKLAECKALNLRPNMYIVDDQMDDWILPNLMKCYSQIFISIMNVILSISMTLGLAHKEASLQLLEFIILNGELFLHVVRDHASLQTLHALKELSLLATVIARATYDDPKAVSADIFLTDEHNTMLHLHTNFLMLLPQLIADSKHQNQDTALHVDLKTVVKMQMYRLQIVSHILGSCCCFLVKSGINNPSSKIFFTPHISETQCYDTQHIRSTNFQKALPTGLYVYPELSVLVSLLCRSATELQNDLDNEKLLKHRYHAVATLTSDELAEYLPAEVHVDQPTKQHQRDLAKNTLQQLIQYKSRENSILSYIIECSAFVMFKHLEFYLLPSQQFAMYSAFHKSSTIVQKPDGVDSNFSANARTENALKDWKLHKLENFRADVHSVLGEPFFRKLKSIELHLGKGRSHVSFLEAILHRLQHLVKIQARYEPQLE